MADLPTKKLVDFGFLSSITSEQDIAVWDHSTRTLKYTTLSLLKTYFGISGQSLLPTDSVTFANITDSGLTASQLVTTDANKKLVSLAVATYPSLTELSYIKGLTSAIQDQLDHKQGIAYGGIYLDNGSTPQNIPTGATYTKLTCFTTNGASSHCTPDQANDKITITENGTYKISFDCSFTSDTNSVVYRIVIFADGVEQANVHAATKVGTGADLVHMGAQGFVVITGQPKDVDLRVRHDNGGTVALTAIYANMTVEKVS